jgi:zinc transport system ATP-binding protein
LACARAANSLERYSSLERYNSPERKNSPERYNSHESETSHEPIESQQRETTLNETTTNPPLIQARDIAVSFNGRQVLQQVSVTIRSGEIVTLIGPNGAGKSTLVRVLLGLTQADSGSIERQRKLRIGYMPQKLHIDANLPITVQRFLRLAGARNNAIASALREVGIPHLGQSPLQTISGGELQRVLLARALLRDPQLLVLDEPVQGVDIAGQTELYELIAAIRDRHHCGVLMVSHDLHLVMAKTDTVICLNHHVCCHGHPEQVSTDPAYLELFGARHSQALAVYQHDHDHDHDIHGDVICDHAHDQPLSPSEQSQQP